MFENLAVKTAIQLSREGKGILVDIRSEEAYRLGHLPGAVYGTTQMIEQVLKKNSDKKIIFYCDYGNQSMRLAKTYGEQGYKNLASIVGGYHAYEGYLEMA